MSQSVSFLGADADATAIGLIGLGIIAAIALFIGFIGRIGRVFLPVVRSRAYTAVLVLMLLFWLVDPVLGLAVPRSAILAPLVALFLFRVVLELTAPRRGPRRFDVSEPPESQFGGWGLGGPPGDGGTG